MCLFQQLCSRALGKHNNFRLCIAHEQYSVVVDFITFLHFYIHGFDHCAGFGNSYYCTHDRIDMAGARRRIFDVSSLQFLEVAELVPESEGALSGQRVSEEEEDQAPEVQAAQPGLWGGALRSDILYFLRRQPSQALDDGQLALYLQFRGVSFDTVMDWGVYFYLEQHQHDSDDQRRELLQQLHAMLGTRDIFDALCFYRYMLEGQVRDEFYAELYNQIASRIQHHPRPAFFADALRALSQQRDDADDTDDACSDTKPADTASTTTAACFASCSRMDVPPISQETRPGSHCTHMFRRAELDLVCMPWFCQVA